MSAKKARRAAKAAQPNGPIDTDQTQRRARPAADNNVQDVLSAIDNYTCGPIRALAQDPPQNSADAAIGRSTVHVVYELHERQIGRKRIKLLTITDSGTTGLDGPMLSEEQLHEREMRQGELIIQQGENWAAWEAMRYTKSDEDKLGSRGQGKYAYLWHSAHPVPGSPRNAPRHAWRMIILYDTLLPNGEYRLGVRYHNPATRLVDPPFKDEAARKILENGYRDEVWDIPLGLEPLAEPGTRVIIPFLGTEAQEAISSGELLHWLTAEWWRKIQKGQLTIELVTADGQRDHVGIPEYWDVNDWGRGDQRYFVKEDLPLPSDRPNQRRRVKRLVLFQDDELADDDLVGPAQFNGVQLLRGGQWITTLEMRDFADSIPQPHRAGFRGFVELDRRLEQEFREIENPAHDGFNKRKPLYRELTKLVEDEVREYAIARGWAEEPDATPEAGFQDLVRELADLFVSPESGGGTSGDAVWTCVVEPVYPIDRAQVGWGDSIQIYARCKRAPAGPRDDVAFRATLIGPTGSRTGVLDERHQRLRTDPDGESASAIANLGELVVERARRPDDPFLEPGRYSIEVSCDVEGETVARGRCSFYVAAAPPPPPRRALTIQLEAFNTIDGGTSINYGEEVGTLVRIRNYCEDAIAGELAVTIEGTPHVLAYEEVSVEGTLPGASPEPLIVRPQTRRVVERTTGAPGEIELPRGTHTVIAAVEREGEVLASATVDVHIGPPEDESGKLPFEVREVPEKPAAPRWRLEDPGRQEPNYVLRLSREDPVLRTIRSIGRPPAGAERLPYVEFVAEAIAEGLVEWAMREYHARGDEGKLRLVGGNLAAVDQELADRFDNRISQLMTLDDPSTYGEIQREIAAIMLEASRKAR